MNILIVYESTWGQTEKIASRISAVATAHGASVTVARPRELRRRLDLAAFDRVVVAGSVKFGRHQRPIVRFAKANRAALVALDAVFLSVSGAAGAPGGVETAREYVATFTRQSGWTPRNVVLAAGGMPFTRLGWLTKRIVVATDRKQGHVRDASRDYDYTDWPAIDLFARELATGAPVVVHA